MARQISDLCFVLKHSHVEGNIGAIRGQEGTVLIDAGPSLAEGSAARRSLEESAHSIAGLVLTHGHFDHAFGAGAFDDVDVIAHGRARSVIEAEIDRQSDLPDQSRLPTGARFPTKEFRTDHELDLGSATAALLLTPGHSPDSLSVMCREDGVLFTGDTVVTCIPPVFRDGSSDELLASFRSLVALEPSVLVPGHGAILVGCEAVKEHMHWSIAYVEEARRLVAEGIGHGHLDVQETARVLDRLTGGRFPEKVHDMAWRHRLTIESLRSEIAHP